ncbi:MAG: RluA family pseudouridine synthase [Tissierellales bacterium]|nr:RluA family pseudouridine synthase [Tissierellales bacterium]
MNKRVVEFIVGEDDGYRLDYYISLEMNELSRNYAQKLIKEQAVKVNDEYKKQSYIVNEGDKIVLSLPESKELKLEKENIPIDIIYEDDDIAIINKPQGLVVHPAPGNFSGTLVNALLYHIDNLSSINGIIRPGIVHRIDKDTSGLLIIAKNNNSHKILSDDLKEHKISREYMALSHGEIRDLDGTIDAPIGRDPKNRKKMAVTNINSKNAITHFHVLKIFPKYTLLKLKLETGRTHQIRVHLSFIKHPIVGDVLYSRNTNEFGINKQMLHAYKISFNHPTIKERMTFYAPLPQEFKNIIKYLSKREYNGI